MEFILTDGGETTSTDDPQAFLESIMILVELADEGEPRGSIEVGQGRLEISFPSRGVEFTEFLRWVRDNTDIFDPVMVALTIQNRDSLMDEDLIDQLVMGYLERNDTDPFRDPKREGPSVAPLSRIRAARLVMEAQAPQGLRQSDVDEILAEVTVEVTVEPESEFILVPTGRIINGIYTEVERVRKSDWLKDFG